MYLCMHVWVTNSQNHTPTHPLNHLYSQQKEPFAPIHPPTSSGSSRLELKFACLTCMHACMLKWTTQTPTLLRQPFAFESRMFSLCLCMHACSPPTTYTPCQPPSGGSYFELKSPCMCVHADMPTWSTHPHTHQPNAC